MTKYGENEALFISKIKYILRKMHISVKEWIKKGPSVFCIWLRVIYTVIGNSYCSQSGINLKFILLREK